MQESVHDECAKSMQRQIEGIKVGNGLDEGTTMGPCINAQQAEFAQTHVDDAVSQGAKVLTGGKKPEGLDKGFFYSPTLLGNARIDVRIFREETFAPVMPLFTCAPFLLSLGHCLLASITSSVGVAPLVHAAPAVRHVCMWLFSGMPSCARAPPRREPPAHCTRAKVLLPHNLPRAHVCA
jgi:Aldehyde dehydrogenase family